MELSAPSVPDESVERVLSGDVPPKASAIREERRPDRTADRAYEVAGTFIDHLVRVRPKRSDFAAGIAAQVIRRGPEPENRAWFADAMRETAEVIEVNLERKVPLLELQRATARKLKDH